MWLQWRLTYTSGLCLRTHTIRRHLPCPGFGGSGLGHKGCKHPTSSSAGFYSEPGEVLPRSFPGDDSSWCRLKYFGRGCQAHSGQDPRDFPPLAGSVGHRIHPGQAPSAGSGLDGFLLRHSSFVSVSSQTDFFSPGKVFRHQDQHEDDCFTAESQIPQPARAMSCSLQDTGSTLNVPTVAITASGITQGQKEEAEVIAVLPWWPKRGWFPLVLSFS